MFSFFILCTWAWLFQFSFSSSSCSCSFSCSEQILSDPDWTANWKHFFVSVRQRPVWKSQTSLFHSKSLTSPEFKQLKQISAETEGAVYGVFSCGLSPSWRCEIFTHLQTEAPPPTTEMSEARQTGGVFDSVFMMDGSKDAAQTLDWDPEYWHGQMCAVLSACKHLKCSLKDVYSWPTFTRKDWLSVGNGLRDSSPLPFQTGRTCRFKEAKIP